MFTFLQTAVSPPPSPLPFGIWQVCKLYPCLGFLGIRSCRPPSFPLPPPILLFLKWGLNRNTNTFPAPGLYINQALYSSSLSIGFPCKVKKGHRFFVLVLVSVLLNNGGFRNGFVTKWIYISTYNLSLHIKPIFFLTFNFYHNSSRETGSFYDKFVEICKHCFVMKL
jgi:hypothetical protein